MLKMNFCKDCKTKLSPEAAFCPICGQDVRNSEYGQFTQNHSTMSAFWKAISLPFAFAIAFMAISIYLWSYVFQHYRFSEEIFIGRVINHTFWVLIIPFIICLFFKGETKARAYSKAVIVVILIGFVLLLFGNTMSSPKVFRVNLIQNCVSITEEILQRRLVNNHSSEFQFCDCLLNKVNDEDIIKISLGESQMLTTLHDEYQQDIDECETIFD